MTPTSLSRAAPTCSTSSTNEQGKTDTYAYDDMGNPKSVKGDTSSLNEVTLDYYPGAPGKLQSVTDGRGKVTSYEYDSAGNLTKITPPAPLGTTLIAYNTQLSRISSTTDGKGQTTTITYDPLDRPTRYDYSDGSSVVLTYDADAQVGRWTQQDPLDQAADLRQGSTCTWGRIR